MGAGADMIGHIWSTCWDIGASFIACVAGTQGHIPPRDDVANDGACTREAQQRVGVSAQQAPGHPPNGTPSVIMHIPGHQPNASIGTVQHIPGMKRQKPGHVPNSPQGSAPMQQHGRPRQKPNSIPGIIQQAKSGTSTRQMAEHAPGASLATCSKHLDTHLIAHRVSYSKIWGCMRNKEMAM